MSSKFLSNIHLLYIKEINAINCLVYIKVLRFALCKVIFTLYCISISVCNLSASLQLDINIKRFIGN